MLLPPFLRWLLPLAEPALPEVEASLKAQAPQVVSSLSSLLSSLSPQQVDEFVHHIQEQVNPAAMGSSPTQEDWYWGRLATGDEEDYYWRRLSDNWYQKDLIPTTSLFSNPMIHHTPAPSLA